MYNKHLSQSLFCPLAFFVTANVMEFTDPSPANHAHSAVNDGQVMG